MHKDTACQNAADNAVCAATVPSINADFTRAGDTPYQVEKTMQEGTMELLWRSSQLSGGNAAYIEDLYDTYLTDPNAVPEQWRDYFAKLPRVNGNIAQDVPHSAIRAQFSQLARVRVRGN